VTANCCSLCSKGSRILETDVDDCTRRDNKALSRTTPPSNVKSRPVPVLYISRRGLAHRLARHTVHDEQKQVERRALYLYSTIDKCPAAER
jgi:hypothetical protein